MEVCPKWEALKNVLKEIEEENDRLREEDGSGKVLVVAQDDRTCNQLKNVSVTIAFALMEEN